MLRSMNDLEDYAIRATDGTIGHVRDFFFDDQAWVIRYLVVETGSWLSKRKVLISPIAISHPNWADRVLPVSITKEQVKNSPDIDTEKPVSRQHEISFLGYYQYPFYWGGNGLWGSAAYPGMMLSGIGYGGSDAEYAVYRKGQAKRARATTAAVRSQHDDPHLRSCKAVMRYLIHATDGDIGYVKGMLVDEETWAVRYFIVDTSNWWFGHQVLISPQWIRNVDWIGAKVLLDLTRQAIKDAPPFDTTAQLNREHEIGIYKHYGRTGYWADPVEHRAVVPH